MTVTPEKIRTLRERTGVGMGKCKEVLVETGGDVEGAVDLLRKKGLATAAKKEGRAANEGKVVFGESSEAIVLVEINCETDFVGNNEKFVAFAEEVVAQALNTKPASLEAFLNEPYEKEPSLSIDAFRGTLVQALGENIQIKRLLVLPKTAGHSFGVYSHMGGKIVTVVDLSGSEALESLAKEVAMHVAAAHPEYLNPAAVPEAMVEREREIAKEQMKGKPPEIIEKILTGKIKAYMDQVCLVCQKFIKDDAVSVQEYVQREAGSGQKAEVSAFWRWSLGEA